MNVIWSPQAKKDYWQNIDYLEAEWTFQDVVNFIDKVDYTIALLDKNNIEFISTNYKNVNKPLAIKKITFVIRLKIPIFAVQILYSQGRLLHTKMEVKDCRKGRFRAFGLELISQ